jgi:uncharacterized protein (UPF0210 family)
MKIRSITCFYDPSAARAAAALDNLAQMAKKAKQLFSDAGYPVQTLRVATPPFPLLVPSCCNESAIQNATVLEGAAAARNFDYLSLGPALPDFPDSYQLIPLMLAETKSVFFSGIVANAQQGVFMAAVQKCAQTIAANSTITPDGFTNLRFAVLANVPAGSPFFPAAYFEHGQPPAFALAMEAADRVEDAFSSAGSLLEARQRLLAALEQDAALLANIANSLAQEFSVHFGGFDFSPAPHPSDGHSLGKALEALGLPALGLSGSMAAAAFLADTLNQGSWQKAGFNGLMLPVLEDSTLAERSAQGTLTLRDLLLYSAVCGTGLDTVPLPGDATAEQITPLLLDIASLAVRLDKPLTARLMPIPGKKAGDATNFDFDYFANGGVMELPAQPLHGLLAGTENLPISPRLVR